jgi:acyl-CoA dehydrogenase
VDFELSEDNKMIRRLAHEFVVDQLKPLERDLLGRSGEPRDSRASLDTATEQILMMKATDTGLWGASVPEELGGTGLGTLANCLIEEELAQTIVPFTFGDVSPILFDCPEAQRPRYFLPVLNGTRRFYLALAEPGQQHQLPDMGTTAHAAGGGYTLNGVKSAFGRPGKDYFAAVFALTVPDRLPTCFLVDAGTTGFNLQMPTGHELPLRVPLLMTLDNCYVQAANRLGNEGTAFALGQRWLPGRRIIRGARSVGVAQRLLEDATLRAQTWQSFGRPDAERPSVQAALAEAATDIHACRLLVYEAAWKSDRGDNVRREAAMVKVFAARMVRHVADSASHIHGGPAFDSQIRDELASDPSNMTEDLQKHLIARDVLNGLKF